MHDACDLGLTGVLDAPRLAAVREASFANRWPWGLLRRWRSRWGGTASAG